MLKLVKYNDKYNKMIKYSDKYSNNKISLLLKEKTKTQRGEVPCPKFPTFQPASDSIKPWTHDSCLKVQCSFHPPLYFQILFFL